MMNTLRIVQIQVEYDHPNKDERLHVFATDYEIDGKSLGDFFGIDSDRPWFGLTIFDYVPSILQAMLPEFLGQEPPQNQFESERLVLFRCHCGCELGGVDFMARAT